MKDKTIIIKMIKNIFLFENLRFIYYGQYQSHIRLFINFFFVVIIKITIIIYFQWDLNSFCLFVSSCYDDDNVYC